MKKLACVTALAILALAGCGPKQQPAQSSAPTPSPTVAAANPTDTAGEWKVTTAVGDYGSAKLAEQDDIINMEPADMAAAQVHLRFHKGSTPKFEELSKLGFQRVDKANMIPETPATWNTATSAEELGDVAQEIINASYDYYSATGTLTDRDDNVHPVLALFVPAEAKDSNNTKVRGFALVIVNLDEQCPDASTNLGIVQGGVIHGPGH